MTLYFYQVKNRQMDIQCTFVHVKWSDMLLKKRLFTSENQRLTHISMNFSPDYTRKWSVYTCIIYIKGNCS